MISRFIKWLRLALSAHCLNAHLAAENLALRQQLGMYKRREKKPRFNQRDRLFWVILYRLWPGCCNVLMNAKPDTLIKWHPFDMAQGTSRLPTVPKMEVQAHKTRSTATQP